MKKWRGPSLHSFLHNQTRHRNVPFQIPRHWPRNKRCDTLLGNRTLHTRIQTHHLNGFFQNQRHWHHNTTCHQLLSHLRNGNFSNCPQIISEVCVEKRNSTICGHICSDLAQHKKMRQAFLPHVEKELPQDVYKSFPKFARENDLTTSKVVVQNPKHWHSNITCDKLLNNLRNGDFQDLFKKLLSTLPDSPPQRSLSPSTA